MKITIITTEYPPQGSGIANVVKEIKERLDKNYDVQIECPDALQWEKIQKQGGKGLLDYWKTITHHINHRVYEDQDVVWLHNPLLSEEVSFEPEKIICTVHTTYAGRWEHMPYALWPKEIFKNIYHRYMVYKENKCYKNMKNLKFTALTEKVRQELESLGIEGIEIDVIPNGVDTDVFFPGEKKKDSFCVATRLCEWKGVDKVVRAFKDNKIGLLKTLKIAGDGPMKSKLVKLAAEDPRITFLGKIPKEEIIKLFQESENYLSQSEYEGMPLTLLEAMSCGCYPMVSDIPGHKEIVDNITLLSTPESIHSFIKENYSWDIIASKYEVLFDEIR